MQKLHNSDPNFAESFARFLHSREDGAGDVSKTVGEIIARVRAEGDSAVLALTQQFDKVALTAQTMRLHTAQVKEAYKNCAPEVVQALQLAAERVRSYHEKQLPENMLYTDEQGITLGWQWKPIDAVGLYVPGGRATYPSSVLMNAIPAKIAGCGRLVMVVPTPGGEINPAVLVAADIAEVDEIYTIGGAQAVAALAFGTDAIAAVDKIVGPGNAFVAEAKRQVFGTVGIDTIAGPSEILVVADNQNDPHWIAADLLSQAEHDPSSQSILITDDNAFADAVESAVESTLDELTREEIARSSWEKHGAIIVVDAIDQAFPLINQLATEHLELCIENAESYLDQVQHAGAIFVGRHTCESLGDYVAGPSHVLPTSRASRFSSGLGVLDFMKRSSIINASAEGAKAIGAAGATLADAEGLGAHALSIRIRQN